MRAAPTPLGRDTPTRRHRHRWAWISALVLMGIVVAGEVVGWPFLGDPVARALSQRMDRRISFDHRNNVTLRVRFVGSLRVTANALVVEAPAWAKNGPMLSARNVDLKLRYRDLLALRAGEPLHIARLHADHLELRLERLADGRASWQMGRGSQDPDARRRPAYDGLRVDDLALSGGRATVHDAVTQLEVALQFAILQGPSAPTAVPQGPASGSAIAASTAAPVSGLSAEAEGRYRGQPLRATLRTGPAWSWLSSDGESAAVPVALALNVGRAALTFNGTVRDLLGQRTLAGHYDLRGPSLFAVGEPLGLTLPTTAPFTMRGKIDHQGIAWHTVVQQAQVGRSQLRGEFWLQQPPRAKPELRGTLAGASLALADLGPALGVQGPAAGQTAPARATPLTAPSRERVLPQREFNLPSLRAMNADVNIALDRLDLGAATLANIQPFRGRLLLRDGLLNLNDIDAQVAQGALRGRMSLDGRTATARWDARLQVQRLRLEDWIKQTRGDGVPPYVTGHLGVTLDITGHGRSTADLLGSAQGRAIVHWRDGTISHLLTEAAGLDAAQALGVWLSGDGALPVHCGAADLAIKDGLVTPRVLLIDSRDSTVWVDGSVSLATERLALVARVAPKDISPLSLRTPVHIDGTLGAPAISLEKGPLLRRLLPAAVLATINPLAALVPLIDTGEEDASKAIDTCRRAVAQRLDSPRM